jgi:riboflavin synthase
MFTGIVTAVGTVRKVRKDPGSLSIEIRAPYAGLQVGESIAVDGACLTVERKGRGWFGVHIIRTSRDRTRFDAAAEGQQVNLERALKVGDRLGGHLVQGHVDAVGTVKKVAWKGDSRLVDIKAPREVARVSIPLGSITVDGVSLTVNAIPAPGIIQISLIPFTLKHTTLGLLQVGGEVHLEGDTVGKYLRSFLKGRRL